MMFLDDHIALAPEHLLGMPESGVCVELYKEDFKDKTIPRVLRLVKYMAECPICGAEVLLDKGEPDYLYSMESIVSGFNPNEKYYYVRGSQPPDADNPYGKNFISGYLLKVE